MAAKRDRQRATRPEPSTPKAALGFTLVGVEVTSRDIAAFDQLLHAVADAAPLAIVVTCHDAARTADPRPLAVPATMQVTQARAGLRLEPGHVYVVPDRRPVVLKAGHFAPAASARRGARTTAAAALFTSIADELGPRAIAVLLSSSDTSAVSALAAIKARHGCVIVQDPASAVVDEAPRAAVASGVADLVLTPVAIGKELSRIVPRPSDPPEAPAASDFDAADCDDAIPDDAFRRVLSLLKSKFLVDLGHYKLTTVRRRVARRMALSRFEQMAAYAEHLRSNPDALKELHDDLFIHVTQFFRDPDSFRALKEQAFPALLKGRSLDEPIRVWVPGCSTGEEAYSLAMTLTEFLEEQELAIRPQLFATDISEAAIQQARRAVYPESLLCDLGAQRVERFFEPVPDGYKVRKELRDLCIISRHDVTSNPPFARLDLISCRNVLIYFGPGLQKRIVPVFHYALKPGGFLWLGRSETTGTSSKLFSLVDKQNKLYSKVPSPPQYLQLTSSRFTTEKIELATRTASDARKGADAHPSADQVVLLKYGPPGVVTNSDFEILQFRGRTAPFLEPPSGQPTQSVLKMAHPNLLAALRPLIQAAKKQNLTVRKERVVFERAGARHTLNLEVAPLNPLAPERERQFLILFEDATRARTAPLEPARTRGRKQTAGARRRPDSQDRYVEQLQQEIDGLREYQQTLIEQFESAQEELTAANEELQATNEEFQSTNEELETAKEELQSANEELTTMNDELQSRNLELVAVNEKLARGEDRFRLMVEGVKDYAIYMLDPDGQVSSWNEGARRLKGYEASEIVGQNYARFFPPEDIAARAPEAELERARIEGRLETEGWRIRKDGSRFWANVVVTRINDSTGSLIGFSKVTRDLTERRRAQDELEKSEQRFKLMISEVRDYAIFMLDPEGRIASWNEGARRLKGYEPQEVQGKHFSIFYTPEDQASGKVSRKIEMALEQGSVEDEGWRVRKDGSRFWANIVITRVDGPRGELLGFTKVTRDLTEKMKAEQALRSANESLELRVRERTGELENALKARDEFLSIASHELKTPLTALKLQLQIARRSLQPERGNTLSPEQASSTFDKALKQATALEELIEDLLDTSRVQAGRVKLDLDQVDLARLVEDAAASFSGQLAQAHTAIELRLEPGIVGRWDQRRVNQVVVNLISNAIKYAPDSNIRISTCRRGDRAEIVVADSGPGISEDKQATIFDRFERAGASPNVGGLGLGLFIARRIVDAHQGNIHVESEAGNGARFIVALPLKPNGAALQANFGSDSV